MLERWKKRMVKKKNGKEKTSNFTFDRKRTVARANVEKMIGDALSTGCFEEIDNLYVGIINATCRHVGHSGPNGFPSKKDKCAVNKLVVDGKATQEKLQQWEREGRKGKKPNPIKKTVYYCKRRKPQPEYEIPTIYNDPHKKEITQFSTACNDGSMNGGCPFAISLNLNNVDDKTILPEWFDEAP